MAANKEFDLLLITDATGSMGSYLTALTKSLPQIIQVSTLTDCFSRIGVLAYHDYDTYSPNVLQWSGWLTQDRSVEQPDIVKFARSLSVAGGGDYEEAIKSALAKAHDLMREDATTIAMIFADAPPHTRASQNPSQGNFALELKHLNGVRAISRDQKPKGQDLALYGDHGPKFGDWVDAVKIITGKADKEASTKARAQFFTLYNNAWSQDEKASSFLLYLNAMSNGAFFEATSTEPAQITRTTVAVLLAWMGSEKTQVGSSATSLAARLTRYVDSTGLGDIEKEDDEKSARFIQTPKSRRGPAKNTNTIALDSEVLRQNISKRDPPVGDFSKRYANDSSYRLLATRVMQQIIDEDVTAVSSNPIFGTLWRTICNDRTNEDRPALIQSFGLQVDRITGEEDKTLMKKWLEDSYDYTAEVLEMIAGVPESEQYPCVCFDPTTSFTPREGEGVDEDDGDVTKFRRDELLEIGRSCDWRILRRLGRVLTRLTYIKSQHEMPAHIAAAGLEEVPRIPLALTTGEHGKKFWKVLLHLVVPGTMLAARPAALLAALSIRMGVQPLTQAAERELIPWRDRWNDLEIPETWNTNCLSLLLDADRIYRESHKTGQSAAGPNSFLLDGDRELFESLVTYKMTEMNLDTTLKAVTGWTPAKSFTVMGPTVGCKSCNSPRSVTVMGPNHQCGLCLSGTYSSEEDKRKALAKRVSETEGYWVECGMGHCRGQYVVYDVEALNVRPKCHYCRCQGVLASAERTAEMEAPLVDCTNCKNRIIYPAEYRSDTFDATTFRCYVCEAGKEAIVETETSARNLKEENGLAWLLDLGNAKLKTPFEGRTLYHVISTVGRDEFKTIKLFPDQPKYQLALKHKPLHNPEDIRDQLQSWVEKRRTESGTCSLCFSASKKRDIVPACGRKGCLQRIDKACLNGWYGLNAPGKLLNEAALHCPFCRRAPTAKILAAYGMGVHAVGNLNQAVQDNGEWIHAWCAECGYAKRYVERVCAAGAPPEVSGWTCDECRENRMTGVNQKVKECPGCKVTTEKTGGCDHISCPNCGTHWCFFCGEEQSERNIYAHMSKAHGGFFDGGDGEDEDDFRDDDA